MKYKISMYRILLSAVCLLCIHTIHGMEPPPITYDKYDAYFSFINPIDDNKMNVSLTRSQFIILMNESHDVNVVNINSNEIKSGLSNLKFIRNLEYDTSTLALESTIQCDSLLVFNYISKPVIGLIFIHEKNSNKPGWSTPQIIWVNSDNTVCIENKEYSINGYINNLKREYSTDVIVPKSLLSTSTISSY